MLWFRFFACWCSGDSVKPYPPVFGHFISDFFGLLPYGVEVAGGVSGHWQKPEDILCEVSFYSCTSAMVK